ncbi:MAG: hypothetical protein MZV64_26800 [Ignavibacteriales bacterium]|nr:hypothetical protein [Ignavibacteriales bacterium]
MTKARELGLSTIGIACNKRAKIKELSDIFISPEVGEEVITELYQNEIRNSSKNDIKHAHNRLYDKNR